ncbi:MAG TPA: 2-dehydropantoate 2-reductase [Kofleriaceae bacterium]|nr:2-dehydropantoate 2-reductase [Kofleriaceae bacterium]
MIGAGGVGCLLAGMLARRGIDVGMLARGAALRAIRTHGIHVRSHDGEYTVPISRVSDDVSALGTADLVIVTAKTFQLAELGPRLAPLLGARALVLPLQNGVEASEQLAAALGEDRVIGGVARVISWIERAGEVRSIIPAGVTIGARHAGQVDATERWAATMRVAGIEVMVAEDIELERWRKFLFIAPYSAIGAVTRAPLGVVRQPPHRARLEAAMREVVAVAAVRGVALPSDAVAATLAWYDALPGDSTTSMHRDIVAGRPSELYELIGAVVRLGRAAQIATPVSAELFAELEPLERRARELTAP